MSDTLVTVENVSKKFCRSLKRSLWYGVRDVGAELLGRSHSQNGLPPLRADEFWAVQDVNFELKRGECLGLIGHNGAGKTTLLKLLNGLMKPDVGRIEMKGRVGALIALGAGFNPILTGRENIYIYGAVLGLSKREVDAKFAEIVDFADIPGFIDTPVKNYSSGMQVRLGFAVAANLHPDILLLDEVLAVGDIAFQAKCFNTLSDFQAKGTAFILVSHNMHHISRYADRVLYLKHGEIFKFGDPDTVIAQYTDDMTKNLKFNEAEVTEQDTIYGSGKVVISSIKFLDALGNEVSEVGADQKVILQIAFTRNAPNIADPVVDIVIRDREGIFFQGTNLVYGQNLGELTEKGFIEVIFEALPANNQQLLFYIAIMDKYTKEVFDWKRNIPLKIKGILGSNGRIQLGCQWELKE